MFDKDTISHYLDQAAGLEAASRERLFFTVVGLMREGQFDPIARSVVTSWVRNHPDVWTLAQKACKKRFKATRLCTLKEPHGPRLRCSGRGPPTTIL